MGKNNQELLKTDRNKAESEELIATAAATKALLLSNNQGQESKVTLRRWIYCHLRNKSLRKSNLNWN